MSSYSVTEGQSVVATVRRSSSSGTASVNWGTWSDSAVNRSDYQGVAWTPLTFAAGETSKTVTVQTIDDDAIESDEVFNLVLSSPSTGYVVGTPDKASVTIADNDGVTLEFSFASPTYNVTEGQSVDVTIKRASGSGTATVSWGTLGVTAVNRSDYEGQAWTPLTFAAGETSKTVTVATVDDGVSEPDETFTVVLSSPSDGYSITSPDTATVTISDSSSVTPPATEKMEFSVGSTDYNVTEGQSVNVTIKRASATGTATVSWGTLGVTAANRSDYEGQAWTPLTFADGETSKTVTVATVDDATSEASETFTVVLSSPSDGYIIASPDKATVTIIDNDTTAAEPGSANLSWVAPATREDGTALSLSEIGGYRLYYGKTASDLSTKVEIASPSATSYAVDNLSSGTYYFAITVYDTSGLESSRSNVVSKTFQ